MVTKCITILVNWSVRGVNEFNTKEVIFFVGGGGGGELEDINILARAIFPTHLPQHWYHRCVDLVEESVSWYFSQAQLCH